MKKVYLFSMLCLFTISGIYAQTIRYVKPSASGSGDGTSWANASGSIQQMIDELATGSGGEVWVAEGTYKPTFDIGSGANARDLSFVLKKDVKIYGGFKGVTSEVNISDRDYENNITILSGDINNDNAKSGNSFHVVVSVGDVGAAVLDGFTVTGGYATFNSSVTYAGVSISRIRGGGIFVHSGNPTVANVVIEDNEVSHASAATVFGGGIYVENGAPVFTNIKILNNRAITYNASTATCRGAGMYILNGNVKVTDVVISGNSSHGRAGGVHISGIGSSDSEFANVEFNNNTSTGAGAAMFIEECSPSIRDNSSFIGNSAGTSGGAVYINRADDGNAANPSFENVTFSGNIAATTAGAVYVYNGQSVSISNSKFISNVAGTSGGAIFFYGQSTPNVILSPTITNSIFYNNESKATGATGGGGAVFISQNVNALTVTNSAFYKNKTTETIGETNVPDGGAIFAAYNSSNLRLYNSILYGNTSADLGEDIYFGGTSETAVVVKNSITQVYNTGETSDNNKIGVNPSFASEISTDANFLHLSQGSPAIEAGDNSFISTIDKDLAGNDRIVHDKVDMGAYEYQGTLPVELTNFTASSQSTGVLLNWSTASENNNDYFILEKSTDGVNFSLLTTTQSKGDANTPQNYSYTDASPANGINYYRLSQKDKDGKVKELGLQSVNFGLGSSASVIYPNPVKDEFSVKLSGLTDSFIKVNLLSLEGKLIFSQNLPIAGGIATVKLDNNVKPGAYIVALNSGNFTERKIITVNP